MKKNYKAAPPVNGKMTCIGKGHVWDVRILNPERVTVPCPVCGIHTSIKQGLEVK